MKLTTLAKFTQLTGAVILAAAATNANANELNYEVSITNITKGIVFTPFLATTHNKRLALFEVGETASEEVAAVAEGGDTSGLAEQLEASSMVYDIAGTDGVLEPGQAVSFDIDALPGKKHLSLISMLLPTNDSMTALLGVALPQRGSVSYYASAYDAGSETNDEFCVNIPGPQCGGEPFSPEDAGEGYIYPAQGIHGEGDLSTSAYQWDGAVLKVTVTRN